MSLCASVSDTTRAWPRLRFLTDLATWSNMSLSSMAELVDDLERLGYIERRPDPRDGRAKLVCLTDTGWRAVRQGRGIIEGIEADWGQKLGEQRFQELCQPYRR